MSMKTALLPEIQQITIKHPRAADYLAKISQQEDCFGLMHDAAHDACKSCLIEAEYKGKVYKMHELCAQFHTIPLVSKEQPTEAAPATEKKAAPAKEQVVAEPESKPEKQAVKKAKPAEKPEKAEKAKVAAASGELSEKEATVYELVKKGTSSGTAIAKALDVWPSQAYAILDQLIERGMVKKEKAASGKGSCFTVK